MTSFYANLVSKVPFDDTAYCKRLIVSIIIVRIPIFRLWIPSIYILFVESPVTRLVYIFTALIIVFEGDTGSHVCQAIEHCCGGIDFPDVYLELELSPRL